MTCIATDGLTLAWDSLTVENDVKEVWPVQKVFVEEEAIYAGAGSITLWKPYIQWIKEGANPKNKPITEKDLSVCMLVFRENKLFEVTHHSPYLIEIGYPTAIGSGKSVALGALVLGHTAKDAVWAASQCDIYTGGPIGSIVLPEKFKLKNETIYDAVIKAGHKHFDASATAVNPLVGADTCKL